MKEFKTVNLVISGVGGQGVVHMGQIIASAAHMSGFDVFSAEVSGMSQGSGSVFTTVRYGSRVYSPVFGEGEGDILIALELLEAVRYVHYLKPDGKILANLQTIIPAIESLKCAPYPILAELCLRKRIRSVILVPGFEIALELGNAKLANCVMLGVLSTLLEFPRRAWLKAMTELLSQDDLEKKHIAFGKGLSWLQESHPDSPIQSIHNPMRTGHAPDLLPSRILA
jgi:indolepyruvate ferredoxin oxidoreductase beta subunit